MPHRRQFIKTSALLGGGIILHQFPLFGRQSKQLKIACQHYTWHTFFRREGKEWEKNIAASLEALKSAGLEGYEPSFKNPDHVKSLKTGMDKQKIWASSTYVNSLLHEESEIENSISSVLAIAREAKRIGINIIVTNPSPIRWGDPIDKTDVQLKTQAKALDRLGAELRKLGITLAYHTHDMEMRQSAREFHHMLLNTDPANVSLCLDSHWVYRGAGNSQVALFDIVKLYGDRIVELHLRQSQNGTWSEVFGEGDIDHPRLADELLRRKLRPHLVLEQAVEKGTPHTMGAVKAIGKSLEYAKQVFKGWME